MGGFVCACISQLRHGPCREIDSRLTAQHNQAVSKIILAIGLAAFTLATQGLLPLSAFAQGCAMCQTVMPQASEPIARGMFWCVLLLLTAPFAVCATIGGWVFYQYRRASRSQSFTASVTLLHPTLANKRETA